MKWLVPRSHPVPFASLFIFVSEFGDTLVDFDSRT